MSKTASPNVSEYVSEKIRELRLSFGGHGISQDELARHLDVQTNTVSRWETGAYKPKLKDLDKLAEFFAVSVSDFFPQKEDFTEPVNALLRAAKDLPDDDIEVLRQFAELKRAQLRLKKAK